MDIAGVSMALSQMKNTSEVGTALLKKSMDNNESMAAGLINMIDKSAMERSVNPAVGGNIDYSV